MRTLLICLIAVINLTAQEYPHFGWHNDDRAQAWAVDLDGSTEYMSKTSSNVNFGTGNVSIIARIKPNNGAVNSAIYDKRGAPSSTNGYCGIWMQVSSSGYAGILFNTDSTGTASNIASSDNVDIRDGKWHLVVGTLTRGAKNYLRIYVDGVLKNVDSSNTSAASLTSFSPLTIGYKATTAASSLTYFKGEFGEMQIVLSYAVTAAEILQIYNYGMASSYSGYSPVFWFSPKSGDSDANMLKDYSSSGNNLSGTNVTTADRVPATYPIR